MKKTEMFQNKNKTATLSVRTPSCKLIGIAQPGKKCQNQRETGTSLVVQWLRLCTPSAGGMGSIPGQRTKIPHAMQHSQKKKKSEGKSQEFWLKSLANCGYALVYTIQEFPIVSKPVMGPST